MTESEKITKIHEKIFYDARVTVYNFSFVEHIYVIARDIVSGVIYRGLHIARTIRVLRCIRAPCVTAIDENIPFNSDYPRGRL